jgi:hypothetical protein
MMAKERRQSNKQITVETLNDKLEEVINERIKLAASVEEVHAAVNFDGGLVYKCDLDDFHKRNEDQHKVLLDKLEKLAPLEDLIVSLEEMVETQRTLQRGSKMVMGFLAFLGSILGVGLMMYKVFTGR